MSHKPVLQLTDILIISILDSYLVSVSVLNTLAGPLQHPNSPKKKVLPRMHRTGGLPWLQVRHTYWPSMYHDNKHVLHRHHDRPWLRHFGIRSSSPSVDIRHGPPPSRLARVLGLGYYSCTCSSRLASPCVINVIGDFLGTHITFPRYERAGAL